MECTRSLFRNVSPLPRNDIADESTERDSASTKENSMQKKDTTIGRYKLFETIGEGSFAQVKLAIDELTGRKVAIKIMDKTHLKPDSMWKLYRESKTMRMLDHPNILKLFRVIETKTTYHIVMEYASGGDMFDYIVRHGRMDEREARAKFRQIVSAVEYCHKKKIIHRDLKDGNILFDSEMNVKIADFGFAREFTPGIKVHTFCGSLHFAAPEMFMNIEYDGPEVDVWSLGIILYFLVTGTLPFNGSTLPEIRVQVLFGKCLIPSHVSTDCANILKTLLVRDPLKRPNLQIIRKDKWISIGFCEYWFSIFSINCVFDLISKS
ncbi:MAP/microtubule affinity-regulating kinase 3-like [Leptinotarsa decemlineata]|uniref:MAP/microtubule affinity-regulating kinase 3-like n=1 Tax=Leptinotarsa decemlineata TaxID=7539 RepID=UPI003D307302